MLLFEYLVSAQGDRLLMTHSVEGRFPCLDAALIAATRSRSPRAPHSDSEMP